MSEQRKAGMAFIGKRGPTVSDMKRDKEAMKAIRYLRKNYSIGAVMAVYTCPELDKKI